MDFDKLLGTSRLYTLHSHTQFCDGRADMEEFVKAAIDAGFTHYGFSPHSPVPFESPCNMHQDDVPKYLAEFNRLNNLYGHKIKLLKSMEVDFLNDQWCAATDRVRSYGLDYIISSVHFIPTRDGDYVDIDGRPDSFIRKMHENFHDDIDYVIDTFFANSQKMIQSGGFDIIGHFDKIGLNASHFAPGIEDTPHYRKLVDDLVDSIIASGVAVEINTKAYESYGRFFPAVRHWKRLKDAGVTILVNSDAHYTHLIDASRPEAYRLLNSLD